MLTLIERRLQRENLDVLDLATLDDVRLDRDSIATILVNKSWERGRMKRAEDVRTGRETDGIAGERGQPTCSETQRSILDVDVAQSPFDGRPAMRTVSVRALSSILAKCMYPSDKATSTASPRNWFAMAALLACGCDREQPEGRLARCTCELASERPGRDVKRSD
jgi:hypothetical protein